MVDARRIYTFFLRCAFLGLFSFVIMWFAFGYIEEATIFEGVVFVFSTIVGLRILSVWIFPDDRGLVEGPRERIANFWSSIARFVLLAPLVAFFTVMKAKSDGSGLEILTQIQLVLFFLNVCIFGLWVFLSHRRGHRVGYGG